MKNLAKYMQKIVIIGGSHAFWEISELINDINRIKPSFEIIAVLDDSPLLQNKTYGTLTVKGPIEKAKEYSDDVKFVFAIGSHRTRLIRHSILERLGIPDERFVTLIHPSAKIFSSANIKYGCIVHYGSVIFNHTIVEPFSIISANCVIAVANHIGRGSMFGSSITTTTGVKTGSYSFVGSGSLLGENVEIGPGAQIGMGSVILKNIPAGAFVLGNPPRLLDKSEIPKTILDHWENEKKTL